MAESFERAIPRPGYKYPWVAVVQSAENEDGPTYVWGLYSQRSIHPRSIGYADTPDEGFAAAQEAALAERS